MIRSLSLITALAAVVAVPAMAEDVKPTIQPGTGPTSTMTDQVPQMKLDAKALDAANTTTDQRQPSSKAMGEAVPSMRPGDAVSGQSDGKSSANPDVALTGNQPAPASALTAQEEKAWVDKPVYSSDGKNIGEVVSFQRDGQNNVVGMHADIGGFLGMGQTSVVLTPEQFTLKGDRVELGLTAAQAKDLPKVQI